LSGGDINEKVSGIYAGNWYSFFIFTAQLFAFTVDGGDTVKCNSRY